VHRGIVEDHGPPFDSRNGPRRISIPVPDFLPLPCPATVGPYPNEYGCTVRSRDCDLNLEAACLSHTFIIQTPLWKGPWLLITAIVLFGTIIWQTRRIILRDRALAEANEPLQVVDQMKTDFFSNVSHELRTPMTAINGYVDNLLDGIAGLLGDRLDAAGYDVHVVDCARACYAAVADQEPDLVLMDIQMPEICGTEALTTLKTHHQNLPILMVRVEDILSKKVASD